MIDINTDALIIIDPQNDFCEGGALAVEGGSGIMAAINQVAKRFRNVIITQDWHGPDQISFASNHDAEPFTQIEVSYGEQTLWPDHCVAGTHGAELHPDLKDAANKAVAIIRKGYDADVDSYSAFFSNDKTTSTGLSGLLTSLGVQRIFICGLALDYCVRYSAEDGRAEGFSVIVIEDLCKGISPLTVDEANESFKRNGIHSARSSQVIKV